MTALPLPPRRPNVTLDRKASVRPPDIQKQIDRILQSIREKPDPGQVALAAQQMMRLPGDAQRQAWVQVLTLVANSGSEAQRRLAEENKRLKQPPRSVGLLEDIQPVVVSTPYATVRTNGGMAEVPVSVDVNLAELIPGREVVLAEQNKALIGVRGLPAAAESCYFDRLLDDGRILAGTGSDRSVILAPGGDLHEQKTRDNLRPGDLIEYVSETHRAIRIADRSARTKEFTGEVPDVVREDLGGMEEIWRRIDQTVIGPICHPDLYKAYGVGVSRGVLITGSPGVGKTSLIKAMAREVLRVLGLNGEAPILFAVGGSEFLRPYVGEGPALIRALVKAAEDTADEHGFALILLDDFEYTALHRGVGDRSSPAYSAVTASLISAMQGLGKRKGRVAFVATANRPDLIDAALLRPGRFTTQITVPRPGFDACKQIFDVHLAGVPMAEGVDGEMVSDKLAHRVFSTADDNVLLGVHYADGTQEEIFPPRVISGAILEATVHAACIRAIARDLSQDGGRPNGVRLEDLTSSLAEELHAAVAEITPHNVGQHFLDLPDDRRVVAVDHMDVPESESEELFVQ